jgi:DHA1 family multidrug resistance protein-like MFS transporter
MIFGPTLGGILAFYLGLRVPFFINGGLAIIAFFFCLVLIREPSKEKSVSVMEYQVSQETPSIMEKIRGGFEAYRRVLVYGGLVLAVALIIRFTRIFSIAIVEPMFAIYATDPRTFGFTPLELGVFFFFFASANAVCQLVFGRLSDDIGHEVPMSLSGIVTASGLLLSIIAATTLDLYMVAILLGVGGAMALPSSTAEAANAAPPTQRGRVMGLLGMGGSAGRAIGPIIGGFFYAAILALTDSPLQAALIPLTFAVLASIIGTLAVVPLMMKSRRSRKVKSFEAE